jgi:GntR family transcriptional regulator
MAQRTEAPQYILLARHLLAKIERGEYPVGSLLPTEMALGEQFGVSRITVRAALRELEVKGSITRRARIGTRVNPPKTGGAFVHSGDSIHGVLSFTQGLPFHLESAHTHPVNAALAELMQLPAGASVLEITGLRAHAHQPPVAYSHHYIPELRAPQASAFDGIAVAVADVVAQHAGCQIATIRQEIEPARLSATQARALQVARSSIALRSKRWFYDQDDKLLVATLSYFPSGRYIYSSVLHHQPSAARA